MQLRKAGVPASIAGIVWINGYLCRELFFSGAAHVNSMQGFWIAMAQKGGWSWFWPTWWPYFDCGMPFEFVYAPLVPGFTALLAWARGIPADIAFQWLNGLVYCLTPVTLFLMARRLARSTASAFVSALLYSLTSPTQLFLHDGRFAWSSLWDTRRLYLMAVWDDTPHLTALTLLPLAILALWLAIDHAGAVPPSRYCAAAVAVIAAAALASDFGPVLVLLVSICLLFTVGRDRPGHHALRIFGIGAYAYAIVSPFLSPTNLLAIQHSSATGGNGWSLSSLAAFAMFACGWATLWHFLPRWTTDRWFQFVGLFTYATIAIPAIDLYFDRHFLPQPKRYACEAEFGIALLVPLVARAIYRRIPRTVRVTSAALLLAIGAEQFVAERRHAKTVTATEDVHTTIEYRCAIAADRILPGQRVSLPGSISKWADAFTDIFQFSGGAWSTAYNPTLQMAVAAQYNGGETDEIDARNSLLWLRAYGAAGVAISGPNSKETWKGFRHPAKFDTHLPLVWREDDVSLYATGVTGIAHLVPEDAIVRLEPRGASDTAQLAGFAASLEEPGHAAAEVQWHGRNHVSMKLPAPSADALAVHITHHPGWHVRVNGAPGTLYKDGLGLMWLRPRCAEGCSLDFTYNGGAELVICRIVSYSALIAGPLVLLILRRRRRPEQAEA